MCIVVDIRIIRYLERSGKADAVQRAEGSSAATASGEGAATPPGSENGACTHGGNSGTWESHMSPG